MKRAERLLTTTRYNANLWESDIRIPVTVIPNTISEAFSDFDENGRNKARDAYRIPGQMPDLNQREISDYYYLVDFFIMTSCFESFGKAAVEAMSRKCIVLSTAVGGLPEVIGNKDDLYDMNDLSKLTDRIKALMDDPEAAKREREMFYKRYTDNYTPDKNIEGHLRVYRKIPGAV